MNPFEVFYLQAGPALKTLNGEFLTDAQLKQRYIKAQAACHPDGFATQNEAQQQLATQLSARLSQSYKVLIDPAQRVKYWLTLSGIELETTTSKPDMALFELQMTLEELLESANQGNQDALQSLHDKIKQVSQETLQWFSDLYTQESSVNLTDNTDAILNQYSRLALTSRMKDRLKI